MNDLVSTENAVFSGQFAGSCGVRENMVKKTNDLCNKTNFEIDFCMVFR